MIAIAEVDSQGMVRMNTPLVHVPVLRADSIVVRLTGFPECRLARIVVRFHDV